VLGPPARVAEGKGVKVRKLVVLDDKLNEAVQAFHRRWYCFSEGEAEERKTRTILHISVGKHGVTESDIAKLTDLTVSGFSLRRTESGGMLTSFETRFAPKK
jgi:hypothetical protein